MLRDLLFFPHIFLRKPFNISLRIQRVQYFLDSYNTNEIMLLFNYNNCAAALLPINLGTESDTK